MNIDQLRVFQKTADAGGVSRAAVKLGVSQSAASRQIASLEAEFRSRLFYRHGRGVALTEAGRALYTAIKPLLEQLVEVKEQLLQKSEEPTGAVIVGMPSSLMGTIGASCAQQFLARYPKASLHLYEGSSGLLVDRLESGLIGAAVLYDTRRGPNMVVTPLLVEQFYLVTAWPKTSNLLREVTIPELARHQLLLPGIQSGMRRAVDAAFKQHDIEAHILMDMHSVTVIKHLVERGIGSTILPYGAIHREVANRYLSARPISLEIMGANLVTATATGQPITRAMQAFLSLLGDEIRSCVAAGTLRGRAVAV
ncbi:LysR family transcriptional regulator [Candidimonas nitroreducens]|uniref:LysR family transcriptional regulator n=1 Tax=Candidimonas nitroreducens TaxID=683354 RepID=A0A225N2S4_9BURK|nr:LysR family transcriptional regulator [Candidimonas nitroreducens]OWT66420.1 LysR family transcriptional regulator [Candidimonas nitroreducens]